MTGEESHFVLKFATDLVNNAGRSTTLESFCARCGLQSLLLFIPDEEVGALLVTLPEGGRWRQFLSECIEKGEAVSSLPWPTSVSLARATGISANGCVLVAVGENTREALLQELKAVLPLIGAAFKGERAALAQAAHAQVAAEAARQAHALAVGLDQARRDVQRELAARRRAEEQVRKRSWVLEVLNRTGSELAAELNVRKIAQLLIDVGAKISGAESGFFVRKEDLYGNSSDGRNLDTFIHGVARDLLAPTLEKQQVVRISQLEGARRMPGRETFRPDSTIKSCLALPVTSRNGQVFGALIFVHSDPDAFSNDAAEVAAGLASAGAIAIDNANLYAALQGELEEHKKAEEALRDAKEALTRTNEELEQRVQERTASLSEAVAQMEEFSYSVSHDLRAPLRAMSGYADALLNDYGPQLDDTARNYLTRIRRSSSRMEKLTHDVLTYSRVARAEVRLERINLGRLIRDLISQYTEFQEPAAKIEIDEPLLEVLGHEVTLGQAITNLFSNAIKFVKAGVRPNIKLKTTAVGDRIRISVHDNGIGINPEHQGRLFNIFERLHPKASYEGTGIGLAIVRKAVERMGGRTGVNSDGINGSEFWIELRRADPGPSSSVLEAKQSSLVK
jgi:signal transduction histidine kinase